MRAFVHKMLQSWAGAWLLVSSLQKQVRSLKEELKISQDRVRQLEGQAALDSHNSSKPPSSDGLKKKPAPKSLRLKGQRKPGGQKGHPGSTLQMRKDPDHIRVHGLHQCPRCHGRDLKNTPALDYESRQVFDLPAPFLVVTEHRAEIKCCPDCGEEVRASFPEEVSAPVQYGPNAMAAMVYLNQCQFIPAKRVGQLFEDLFGTPVSPATVTRVTRDLSSHLEPFIRELQMQLPQKEVVHADETGLRVKGKLFWLHLASSDDLTFHGVYAGRGKKAMDSFGILAQCRQWLVHDCWKPYFRYPQCLHALCNQHIVRELKYVEEEEGERWAKELGDFLLALNKERKLHGELDEAGYEKAKAGYLGIVAKGRSIHPRQSGGGAQSKTANLLDRLENFAENILAFTWDQRVPFTNNQAERDIRMMKVRQKISGCFRTLQGAKIFCRIRSYTSTCQKQGVNVWKALISAMQKKPFIPSLMPSGP